jgi:hypothetical protein
VCSDGEGFVEVIKKEAKILISAKQLNVIAV